MVRVGSADDEEATRTNQPPETAHKLAGIVFMLDDVVTNHGVILCLESPGAGICGDERIVSEYTCISLPPQKVHIQSRAATVVENAVRAAGSLSLHQLQTVAVADTFAEGKLLLL
jgi:hypothetical protein